ncbi:hypothetical protein [Roseomonas sp. KE2513]|nr:hypothetical protein [Roseomonas sp. KE2513]
MYTEQVTVMWAAILCAALLGTGFYTAISLAERWLVFWGAEQ